MNTSQNQNLINLERELIPPKIEKYDHVKPRYLDKQKTEFDRRMQRIRLAMRECEKKYSVDPSALVEKPSLALVFASKNKIDYLQGTNETLIYRFGRLQDGRIKSFLENQHAPEITIQHQDPTAKDIKIGQRFQPKEKSDEHWRLRGPEAFDGIRPRSAAFTIKKEGRFKQLAPWQTNYNVVGPSDYQ